MAIKSRANLKTDFETGDMITQSTCEDLIDTCIGPREINFTIEQPEEGEEIRLFQSMEDFNMRIENIRAFCLPQGTSIDVQFNMREQGTPTISGNDVFVSPTAPTHEGEFDYEFSNQDLDDRKHLYLVLSNQSGLPETLFGTIYLTID